VEEESSIVWVYQLCRLAIETTVWPARALTAPIDRFGVVGAKARRERQKRIED
jgi:hypothetical protein